MHGIPSLLARGDDLSAVLNLCLPLAIIIFAILVQVLKRATPEAMGKKIRELQEAARAAQGARRTPPSVQSFPIAEEVLPVGLAESQERRRKKAQPAPAAATPAASVSLFAAGLPDLAQAVVLSEILAPPLSLRPRRFARSRGYARR